ncbi:mucoidy inhibitor MuiA family protein [Desulfococcaceae bacterium HSG9]|nr:mucoidy inhibitor MuiA family protein [Desulfococcaceae bacterium HSG9]
MDTPAKSQFSQDEIIREGDCNRIAEAVVFTDQAYIKRKTQAHVQTGLNRLCVELQAFQVDSDSVQAAVYGRGEIISVQYKEIPVKDAPQKNVKEVEDEIKVMKRQRRTLEQENEVLNKQQRFLDSVINFGEKEIPKKIKTVFPKTDDLKTMLLFLEENYKNLADENERLFRRIEETDDELTVLKMRLKQIRQPEQKFRKVIEVLFLSQEAHEINLIVSYVVQNAFWKPVYKADAPLDLSRLNLTMFARIRQTTGENWENITLAVSNAIPLKGAALPDLHTWRVGMPNPVMPMAATMMVGAVPPMRKKKRGKAHLAEETALMAASLEEPEAHFTQAEEKKLPLAFEYQLPQQTDIKSGGDETLLPLYSKEVTREFYIYTAPAIDPLCYLVCRAEPDSTLLSGRLNIYFGGRFVGSAALTEKQAGEDLLINLGAERGVKVRRSKITDKVNETFFGIVDRMSTARTLVYRITVENLKDEAVRVRLTDRIPVSATDRISIKGVETDPEPTEKDYLKREGVMLWDFEMSAKNTKIIEIRFDMKHPNNIHNILKD